MSTSQRAIAERPDVPPELVESWMEELSDVFALTDEKISDWAHTYARGHVDHYRSIFEMIRKISNASDIRSVLDIGGVPGHVPALLRKGGYDVTVADLAPERAADLFNAIDVPFIQVNIERDHLPLVDEFDLVLFNEILEHLRLNPLHAIQEIFRALRPGGHLLLSVPQITILMRWKFLWENKDYQDHLIDEFKKIDSIGHMGHFRMYSEEELSRTLSAFGFRIEEIAYGGKMHRGDDGIVARFCRTFYPERMRAQVYVWASKPLIPITRKNGSAEA